MRAQLLLACALVACGGASSTSSGAPADDASAAVDSSLDAVVDTTPPWDGNVSNLFEGVCAKPAELGAAFTDGFGRADGVVTALVPPTYACDVSINSTHLTIEVRIAGKVQRLVVTMRSKVGEPEMRFAAVDAALRGGPWAEGWHLGGITLDYLTDLGVRAKDFQKLDMAPLTAKITEPIAPGDRVSIFATAEGRPESAHLVHRSTTVPGHDGAIVVRPDSATPRWLLFHFSDQDAQFP